MNSRFRELLRNNVVDVAYYMCLHKGGKGAVSAQPIVEPTPPVEDASVELSEDDNTKLRNKSGKATLKIPLASSSLNTTSSNTGLKV